MARRNGTSTLSEGVLNELRSNILSGKLSPGEALKTGELSKRFDVSIAVIREALNRLTEQGLITLTPNHGFNVKTLNLEELDSISEVRLINESEALRLAMIRGDISWESNLVAIHYKLTQTPQYIDKEKKYISETWAELHKQFHFAMLEGCNNPILLDICERLWNLSELYRHWSIPRDLSRDIAKEHKLLMDTVLARKIDHALDLYKKHKQLTVDILLDIDN